MAWETEGKTLDRELLRQGLDALLRHEDRGFYTVAEVGGRVVGQLMITYEWSDWRNGYFWWFQSVYVAPSFRCRGIFRALYEHIRDLAKSRPDVCGLRLYVHRDNRHAMDTYRKLGMTLTEYLLCEEGWQ